jgi:hypothetical protein
MQTQQYSTANQFTAEKTKIRKTLIKPVAIYGAESFLNSWLFLKEKF